TRLNLREASGYDRSAPSRKRAAGRERGGDVRSNPDIAGAKAPRAPFASQLPLSEGLLFARVARPDRFTVSWTASRMKSLDLSPPAIRALRVCYQGQVRVSLAEGRSVTRTK